MELRTKIKIAVSPNKIDHKSQLLCIGSCFSQSVGEKIKNDKFECLINPFGTLYNPVSIARALTASMNDSIDPELIINHSRYLHLNYHSDITGHNKEELINNIKRSQGLTRESIIKATHIIITLGTAYSFNHITFNKIVGNCHKLPASQFERILLSKEKIFSTLSEVVEKIRILNPDVQFLLTVSPVRHIRDGLIKNNLSKAILIQSCHELLERYSFVDYFPSYDIMMDDLRDYRFYSRDLVHPSQLAIDYIYERFSECYYDQKTINLIPQIRNIKKAIIHRPIQSESAEHQQFLKKHHSIAQSLSQETGIDLTEELATIKNQILS